MDKYRYQLNLAEKVWTYESPVELEVDDNCQPFQICADHSDFTISYQLGDPKTAVEEKVHEGNPIVWRGAGYTRVERLYTLSRQPHSCYYLKDEDPFHVQGLIYPGKQKFFESLIRLIDVSDLEVQLTAVGAISLHSSLIRYQGQAILFTGPSGIGKSTQAALWERYRQAEQLNGDRTILRKTDGAWNGFGSPFAGTSGIFRNESAPIRAIVVLRQADENSIRHLGSGEAFRYLYSESIVPRWNDRIHTRIMDIITQIVTEVPVIMMACRPDETSVSLLDQFLQEELNDR